ncbi:MAG: hypothetical protein ACXAC7_14770 [Candidatus Hodarchaeales archaeon]|jgi:hypothetical protein
MKTVELEIMLRECLKIALKDGEISTDEKKIIDSVLDDLEKFNKAYQQAWDDNIITKEEKELLNKLWNEIYNNSEKIAMNDRKITIEEFKLLKRISRTIRLSKGFDKIKPSISFNL